MAIQKFNPDNVMVSTTLGKEISYEPFTREFLDRLVETSAVVRLGEQVDMGNQKMIRKSAGVGELTNAYFVGEGQKIGTAKVEAKDYVLEARKIAVILPVTEEFLQYSWTQYFSEVVPLIADKFNKMIDGAVFLGLHNDPFGANVVGAATNAENVVTGPLSADTVYDLESITANDPNAFVGHRTLNRVLRTVRDNDEYIFERPTSPTVAGTLDGLPYLQLQLANGETYPENTLITGYFNDLKFGIPNGTALRLKIDDSATLSTIQNDGTVDSGDVHMFEQDIQALRAIFEIAVAIPNEESFAVLKAGGDVEI